MAATTKADIAKQKAEQDAILARVSVALARSQRLIDSWLPASSSSQHHNEEDEANKNASWGGLPDRVGLGGKVDGVGGVANGRSAETSELDKLRKQLMGKKAGNIAGLGATRSGLVASKSMNLHRNGIGNTVTNGATASATRKDAGRTKPDSESEDEGGRSAAFKSKKQPVEGSNLKVHPAVAALEAGKSHNAPDEKSGSRGEGREAQAKAHQNGKRKMSYLDEVLAERARKKKQKKKKKTAATSGLDA